MSADADNGDAGHTSPRTSGSPCRDVPLMGGGVSRAYSIRVGGGALSFSEAIKTCFQKFAEFRGRPCDADSVPRGGHSPSTRHREARVVVVHHACSLRLDHPDCVLGKRRGQRAESIRAASWCPSGTAPGLFAAAPAPTFSAVRLGAPSSWLGPVDRACRVTPVRPRSLRS